jgi:hypothetical protein
MPTRAATLATIALCVVVCAACAVTLALTKNGGFAGVAAAIAAAACMVGLLLAMLIEGLREIARTGASTRNEVEELRQQLRTIDQHIELTRSSSALSERAKSVISRGQEKLLLIQAIEDDIAGARFASALALTRQLASLGEDEQASALAHQAHLAQQAHQTQQAQLAQQPQGAQVSVQPTAQELQQQQVAQQQAQLKTGLEQAFHAAAKEGRTDDAMMILSQLDALITPEEAAPLREIARDVVAKARDGLGEKFRIAIQEKRWKDAITYGEQIARQFPNSRMASEVSNMLDALRTRAAE